MRKDINEPVIDTNEPVIDTNEPIIDTNEPVISVAEMREADARTIAAGTPGIELMMRAARGVFDAFNAVWNGNRDRAGSDDAEQFSKRTTAGADNGIAKNGWAGRRTLIFCGSGNNGGDGYALAVILKEHDFDVTIIRTSEKLSEDGGYYFEKCKNAGVKMLLMENAPKANMADAIVCSKKQDMADLKDDSKNQNAADAKSNKIENTCICSIDTMREMIRSSDVIVDCMLGTGFAGVPRGNIKTAIENINQARSQSGEESADQVASQFGEESADQVASQFGEASADQADVVRPYIISVDINSGMNGDTGQAELAVKSDLTVSIGFFKTGLFQGRANELIGKLVNVDIGIKL